MSHNHSNYFKKRFSNFTEKTFIAFPSKFTHFFKPRHEIIEMKTISLDRVINTLSNCIQTKTFSCFAEIR